jgi:hypothetical protein
LLPPVPAQRLIVLHALAGEQTLDAVDVAHPLQPDRSLNVWFRERVGTERGRIRRIAIVARARKLLIALWRYVTHGEVPEGAMLKTA